MAATIIDFPGLKTAVETWREQAGEAVIQNNVDDCIRLGEAHLNRKLKLREMWLNETLIGTDQSRELDLPSDYAESRWLKSASDFKKLDKRSADKMCYFTTASATPSEWCVNGDHIDLNELCSGSLSFILRYREKFNLSTQKPTNWLLTNHPDVYLASVLVWSGLLLKDDDIAAWSTVLREGIEELNTHQSEAGENTTLTFDPMLATLGKLDINTDDYR